VKTIDRRYPRLVSILLLVCLAVGVALVPGGWSTQARTETQQNGPGEPRIPVGGGFTYQGSLKDGGNPANGQYDFTFELYDALTGGNQVGTTQTFLNQMVTEGLFTVSLDFGVSAFQGQARWLEIAVRQAGGGAYTTLSPRQSLTAVPYAMSLMPSAVITSALPGVALSVINTNANGTGVYGYNGGASSGFGVFGDSFENTGVYGRSNEGDGVQGYSTSGRGVVGDSSSNDGVQGYSFGSGRGVYGDSTSGEGVSGSGVIGVYGNSTSGSGIGVSGVNTSNTGWATSGVNNANSGNARGVVGGSTYGYAVYGGSTNGWAGWFDGNVNVTGTCCAASEGSFKIDHPLDPENKYLVQSAVESADMMGIYNGNVTTDAKGEAVVTLPDWFEALNKDFRYQLTPIGQFAQAIVASEVKDNRFTIKTDKPNVKVSWQVTGIRHDPYADKHRIPVEEDKPADERGTYLHPTDWGQPESKGLGYEERQRVLNDPTVPQQPKP
jgi:hypothetical protein